MPMLADVVDAVIGVDTHSDTHTAAVVDRLGAHLATIEARADAAGYAQLIAFAAGKSRRPVPSSETGLSPVLTWWAILGLNQ